MGDILAKIKYPSLILIVGSLLVLVSFFSVDDIKQFKFHQHDTVYPTAVIGIILILLSAVLFTLEEEVFPLVRLRHTKKTKDGYEARMGKTTIKIIFGRIEDLDVGGRYDAIVLPANEYFDDDCIIDPKSSLGAFMTKRLAGRLREVQKLVVDELDRKQIPTMTLMKTAGVEAKSFGVGTSVFLSVPLQLPYSIILSAVTTMRAGQGLRCEINNIFSAVRNIDRILKDHKIESATLPLFGTGHGGLPHELAFLTLLLALSSVLREGGAHPSSITIVIFRASPEDKPKLSPRAARRMLNLTASLHPK